MASPSLIAALLKDVSDGLRVFRDRDHVPLTDVQLLERARNIVNGLIGNYAIFALHGERDPKVEELQALYAQGKPQGHGQSCACRDCNVFNQARRAQ